MDKYPAHRLAARALYAGATNSWSQEDHETAKRYFQRLLDNYPADSLAKRARKNIVALGIIGQDAPELVVDHWVNGTGTTLAASEGKIVLLAFWNEWCPHSRRELPKLGDLQVKYAERGLVVIPVTKHTKSQTDGKVEKFMADSGIDLDCAVEPAGYQTSREYGVSGVPSAAVVNREGRVIWRNHPARLSEEQLERFLSQ